MDVGDPTAAEQALEDLHVSVDHLIKLVEDRALESLDDTGLVGFLQGFERLRNRLPLVDHQMIKEGTARGLAQSLCQGTMTRVLSSTLLISGGEASARVRAAEALAERMSLTGQPLEPVRPHLAEKQRSGEISSEKADIVVRALAPLDRRGFDPAGIEAGEQLLADFATQFGPRELRRLAQQVVDRIDPDGTLPDEERQQDRRFFRMRPTKDGSFAGEFRLTGDCGSKLLSLLHPLAKPRVNSATTGEGKRIEQPDPRTHGQRMHDALHDVCSRMLRSENPVPDSGGTPATVIVTIDVSLSMMARDVDPSRLTAAQRRLFEAPDLLAVGWLANREREKRHGARTFYNYNIRLEATNVCLASCLFCSFARLRPTDDEIEA